jgi:hypothetical protein
LHWQTQQRRASYSASVARFIRSSASLMVRDNSASSAQKSGSSSPRHPEPRLPIYIGLCRQKLAAVLD